MKQDWKQVLLGLLLISVMLVGAIFFLIKFSNFIAGLDNKIATAVIGGGTAILLAIFGFWREVRKARKEGHREQKIEVYKKFSNIVFELVRWTSEKKETTEYINSEKFKNLMWELKEGIIFYGSPNVINTFCNWIKATDVTDNSTKEVMMGIGDVLLAMRADLGLSNSGLTNISIHQIYITDDVSKL